MRGSWAHKVQEPQNLGVSVTLDSQGPCTLGQFEAIHLVNPS